MSRVADRSIDWPATLRRAGSLAVLGALPLLIVSGVMAQSLAEGYPAWDFHHELYPQADLMLAGENPYPPPDFEPLVGNNKVWPPAAAALAAPFTLLPTLTADVTFALLGLACFAAALWLVGVRDWRVYGCVALWPPVYMELGLSHLTPFIALLIAVAWRSRESTGGGVVVGVAVALKLFVWPLAVWLLACGRQLGVVLAALVVGGSLLLVLPFTGLDDYVRAVLRVGEAYAADSYTIYGLVAQAGGPALLGRFLTVALVAALLVGTTRYRSFTLAVATSLAASPIVWLDYFALAAIPLALARPRLSPVWFAPLATVGLEGAGWQIGDTFGTLRVLVAFAVVLAVAFRVEQTILAPSERTIVSGARTAAAREA